MVVTLLNVPDGSWLRQTKQLWKFRLFVASLLLSFLLLLLYDFVITEQYLKYASIILGSIAVVVLLLLIKCPSCNKRPIFAIIRQTDINKLTQAILAFSSCPYCGYRGTNG